MKRIVYFYMFSVFFHYSFVAYTQTTGDDLWNQYKSDPDRHPNIPNCSYAGYKGGECGSILPNPSYTIYNVKNAPYNAKGDGTTDDTQAFEAAIAAAETAGNGIVFVPAGTYLITKFLRIKKKNVILRGAGKDLTTLNFTKSLQNIYGNLGSDSNWWWSGGLIWVGPPDTFDANGKVVVPDTYNQSWEYWRSPSVITTVTAQALKGDQVITVSSSANLSAGKKVLLTWENPADKSLLKQVYGHAATEAGLDNGSGGVGDCAWIISPAYPKFQWPVEIKSIAGNNITLSQPLRIDIKTQWNVRVEEPGQSVQEVGIEDLRIQCHAQMAHNHLQAPTSLIGGWNGVYMNRVWNCWIKNVTVSSAENGFILAAAKNVTVTNTFMDGPEQNHHSYACRVNSHDNLFEKFTVNGPKRVRHGINTEWLSSGNVWSKGLQKAGTFDSHRALSFDFIRTECVVANDAGSTPGGHASAGPFMGKRGAHWNIHVYIDPAYPLTSPASNGGTIVYQPKQYSMGAFVGVRGTAASTAEGVAMPAGDKGTLVADNGVIPGIVNLYEEQRKLRCGATHVAELEEKNVITLYPNPANDVVVLEKLNHNSIIEFYDVLGKKVLSQIMNTSHVSIDLSGFNPGIYFFRIINENSGLQTGKFIKN